MARQSSRQSVSSPLIHGISLTCGTLGLPDRRFWSTVRCSRWSSSGQWHRVPLRRRQRTPTLPPVSDQLVSTIVQNHCAACHAAAPAHPAFQAEPAGVVLGSRQADSAPRKGASVRRGQPLHAPRQRHRNDGGRAHATWALVRSKRPLTVQRAGPLCTDRARLGSPALWGTVFPDVMDSLVSFYRFFDRPVGSGTAIAVYSWSSMRLAKVTGMRSTQ